MFEKFAEPTREVVKSAVAQARESGTTRIGCEHLLVGIAHGQPGPAVDALAAEGLSLDRLRELIASPDPMPLDADALAVVGIDLDEVIRAAESAFGPGALDRAAPSRAVQARGRMRLTPDAKIAIELALKAARRTGSPRITPGHILVGVIDQGDNGAVRILEQASVRSDELRADTVRRMGEAA
jgi:ATP-dependent Clp protease ATP-binding subunit ClpA